jgi:hypothetical protein
MVVTACRWRTSSLMFYIVTVAENVPGLIAGEIACLSTPAFSRCFKFLLFSVLYNQHFFQHLPLVLYECKIGFRSKEWTYIESAEEEGSIAHCVSSRFMFFIEHYLVDEIKKTEMVGECSTRVVGERNMPNFSGKVWRKKLVGRSRAR